MDQWELIGIDENEEFRDFPGEIREFPENSRKFTGIPWVFLGISGILGFPENSNVFKSTRYIKRIIFDQ